MTHTHHPLHDHDHDHDHEHPHGHAHAAARPGHRHSHAPTSFGRAFAIGIALNRAYVVGEAVYGVLANSLALLADAGHNVGDVLSLGSPGSPRRWPGGRPAAATPTACAARRSWRR